MKGPAPSQGMKRGRSSVGTLCSAVGRQKAGRPDMSTMAWSPLLLTLFALCTGDWMWGQGKGPGKTHPFSLLFFLKPTITISVSHPSRILGPGCADAAALRVRDFGSEGHPLLHWKQQQHWGFLCELVPAEPHDRPPEPSSMVLPVDPRGSRTDSPAPGLATQQLWPSARSSLRTRLITTVYLTTAVSVVPQCSRPGGK